MADFESTTTVDAAPQALFDHLSDVGDLPTYFSRTTSARPGDGDTVRTTAPLPDGREVEGDATFTVDKDAKTLEWGSEGPSSYGGRLEVEAEGMGSTLTVHLHTTRVEAGDARVQQGIDETVAHVKKLVEGA